MVKVDLDMSKTLKQAFTMWAYEQENTAQAARNREAVNKVLMKKYNDVELEQFTASLAERIFKQCKEKQELKTKAASTLVHVLNYGAEKGWCSKPTFTFEIASPMKDAKAESVDTLNVREKMQVADLDVRPISTTTPMYPCDEHGNPIPGEPSIIVPLPSDVEPKEENMKPKKPRGKQPKPVAQIDPKTLQVIKVWPSMTEAQRELGLSHIDVAVRKLRKAGGFYWSLADYADTFKDLLTAKTEDAAGKKAAEPKSLMDQFEEQQHEFEQMKREGMHTVILGRLDPTGEAQPHKAAADALKVFTDEELIAALTERGFEGELTRVQRFYVGKKE